MQTANLGVFTMSKEERVLKPQQPCLSRPTFVPTAGIITRGLSVSPADRRSCIATAMTANSCSHGRSTMRTSTATRLSPDRRSLGYPRQDDDHDSERRSRKFKNVQQALSRKASIGSLTAYAIRPADMTLWTAALDRHIEMFATRRRGNRSGLCLPATPKTRHSTRDVQRMILPRSARKRRRPIHASFTGDA